MVALDFRRANFNKLKRLVGEALGSLRAGELSVQDEWSFLKETILRAQGESIPTRCKGGRSARKPPWLTKGVRECLTATKAAYTRWKGVLSPRGVYLLCSGLQGGCQES